MSRELLSPEGLRLDGRRPGELRKITIELGVLEGVDGSCLYHQGHTRVLASVIGPVEAKGKGKQSKNEATLDVEFVQSSFASAERKDQKSKSSRANKETALFIHDIFSSVLRLELFPSSSIFITVTVLSNQGSVLACAINAVCLALMHAGVPMKDLVFAATGSVVDTVPMLDLNSMERGIAGTQVTVAHMYTSKEIVSIQSENKISIDNLNNVLELIESGCTVIGDVCKDKIRQHISGSVSTTT